jgi:hypothetical protein
VRWFAPSIRSFERTLAEERLFISLFVLALNFGWAGFAGNWLVNPVGKKVACNQTPNPELP